MIPCIVLIGFIASQTCELNAQASYKKPGKRSGNLLQLDGQMMKTINIFPVAYYDTLLEAGTDPLLLARYNEDKIIPEIMDAVFSSRIEVFNPNFWGSVPQLLNHTELEVFDTNKILNYLSAGWDSSLVIDAEGKMETQVDYKHIPYHELSGLFFFESWWLDEGDYKLYKDVHAYLPIREYLASIYEGYENTEIRKRLLFMVVPDFSAGKWQKSRYRTRDFYPIKDVEYHMELYNKSYNLYLDRNEDYDQISKKEYFEWQYHQFDFYRHFDPDLFLEKLITGILEEKLTACLPGENREALDRDQFIKLLMQSPFEDQVGSGNIPDPENYPLNELNSFVFNESWYMNPDNLQIFKQVRSITINRHEVQYDNYTGDFIQSRKAPLFTIWYD